MMQLQIYKSTTDISDYVTKINGFEFRRSRDLSLVLPHPTIEVKQTLSVSTGDIITFKIDSDGRLATYVEKIIENKEEKTYTLNLKDLLKKLEKYYIGDISSSDWSGYSPSISEYRNEGNALQDYISVMFLLRVLIRKATGYSWSNILTDDVSNLDSVYYSNVSGTNYIKNHELLLQWEQLKAIGRSDSTDETYKGATYLDVFLALMQAIQIKMEYSGPIISNSKVEFKPYSSYTVPGNDSIYKQKPYDLPLYDFVNMKLQKLTNLFAYYSAWASDDLIDEEANAPSSLPSNKKKKSYNLLKHFEIHYRVDDQVVEMKLTEFHKSFVEQYVDNYEDVFTNPYKKYSIKTDIDYTRDPLLCRINRSLKDISSGIDYLYEVT